MENVMLKLLHTVRDCYTGEGWSLAWDPTSGEHGDPLILAFCGSRSKVRVWDLFSPSIWESRFEGHILSPGCCAWSPCGQLLAATWIRGDNITIFKDQEDFPKGLLSFSGAHEFKGEMRKIVVCWSASGSLLATCGCKDNCICIWKINIAHIAFRPDLQLVHNFCYQPVKHGNCGESGFPGDRKLTCAWRMEPDDEFELVAYLRGHDCNVNYVQWHPKMDVLFSCSSDHSVKVWMNLGRDGRNNWQCVQTLEQSKNGHNSTVWSLSFNADGDKMVTSSNDGTLKIWETKNIWFQLANGFADWRHLYTLTRCHDGAILSVHWSREGIIATGGADGMIGLFVENMESRVGRPVYQLLLKEKAHDEKVNSVQWSPGEDMLLASTSDDETIKVWRLEQANEEVGSNSPEENEDDI